MGDGMTAGWHRRIGPLPVVNALHGLSEYGAPGWVDHASRVRLPDGRWLYTAEPYSLDTEALADLAHLAANGWDVSVTAWRARHLHGHTLAVEIVAEGHPAGTPAPIEPNPGRRI